MKSKKASIFALFLVLVMSIMCTPALAAQPSDTGLSGGDIIITPYWTKTNAAQATISVSDRVLKPSAYVSAKSTSTEITGTLYLEKKSGSSWSVVTSWDVSGTGILLASKSYTGTSGTVYRSRLVVSVGGEYVECASSECEA